MTHKLLIIGQLPPPVHGSNVMTELFYNSVKKIGYEAFLIQKTFSMRQEDIGKLSGIKLLKFPLITAKLIHRLILDKPDLCFYFISVKLPSFFVDALFLLLIRMFGVKYVIYQHGKGLLDLENKLGRVFGFIVHKTISPSLGGLVLGERLKLDVNKFISNKRLFVLPNAIADVNPENLKFIRNSKGSVKILFLSNLKPSKGPLEFLKMAKRLIDKRKDVRFILAGPQRSEPFQEKIKNYINHEDLSDFVEMPGGIYGPEKQKLFYESDIFVFPTFYKLEAFPLVNLEAMRAGLPVVSSNEGSISEAVIDGLNGYIVDPKDVEQLTDRVLRLIEDPELRNYMGKAGREIYENSYTIDAYVRRLEQGLKFFLELKGASNAI